MRRIIHFSNNGVRLYNEVEENPAKLSKISVDWNGFLVDTNDEKVTDQGMLRFKKDLYFDVEKQICILIEQSDGKKVYKYDILNDKFSRLNIEFDSIVNPKLLKTERYVVTYLAHTGTYGDFRGGYFSIYNRKKGTILNLGGIVKNYIRKVELIKETSNSLSLLIYAQENTGAFSKPNGFVFLCTIDTVLGTFINQCQYMTKTPGDIRIAKATLLKDVLVCYDKKNIIATSIETSTVIFSQVLNENTISGIKDATKIMKLKFSTKYISVVFDNGYSICFEKTNDRGLVQKVVLPAC